MRAASTRKSCHRMLHETLVKHVCIPSSSCQKPALRSTKKTMKHNETQNQSKKILLFQICEGLLSTGTGQPTAIWTSTLTPASVVEALNTVGICLDISGQISLRSKQKRKEPEALRVTLAHKLKDSLPKCRPLACGKCMKMYEN